MTLARKRSRRPLSITSLIDVIFLLLLFFMLASTFTKFAELEVASGGSAGLVSSAPVEIMQLIVGEASLSFDGRALAEGDLPQAVRGEMERTQALSLRVTSETSSQRLTDILTMLEPVDGLQVNMAGPS